MLCVPVMALAQPVSNNPTITPNQQTGVYTTHGIAPFGKGQGTLPSPDLLNLDQEKPAPGAPAKSTTKEKPAWLNKIPFGKPSSDTSTFAPKGTTASQAVPVQGVDTIEVTEPAAASTAPLEADPAKEDPAEPTEETAPIFSATQGLKPQHVVFRALNKVTGRASVVEVAPNDAIRFGKLSIAVLSCQISDPNSQRDDAGFFDITEQLPETAETKSLFRGWMYASSPSITSLEHPIYDVTMVECVTDDATRTVEKKSATSPPLADADATTDAVLD